jgi:hypothetical protein
MPDNEESKIGDVWAGRHFVLGHGLKPRIGGHVMAHAGKIQIVLEHGSRRRSPA